MIMTNMEEKIWQAKAAAWVHDPGEKQLILFRRGHETGNAKRFAALLNVADEKEWQETPDRWASASDRPQFEFKDSNAPQVRFASGGVLKHALCGIEYPIGKIDLSQKDLDSIEDEIFGIAVGLMQQAIGGKAQADTHEERKKALLALWRFLPAARHAPDGYGELWRLLPADSRVPDHAIWTHLDLASALAGAMAGDENGEVALLMVSLGPVQEFIAQARSTSDLWAGSHLLSRLTLAAMEPLLDALGPDAVIFPHLRGLPLVDLWLIEQGLPPEMFDEEEWRRQGTDFNPLFMATLPNLFLAIVPASQVQPLAEAAAESARRFMREQVADKVVEKLLDNFSKKWPEQLGDTSEPFQQLDRQLADFPEVYWAAAPWARKDEDFAAARKRLEDILVVFAEQGKTPGVFDNEGFKALAKEVDATIFKYAPNPGVLYPAAHQAVSRAHGAVKTLRPFGQTREEGYRCSLCGEREWLTLDREQLHWTRRRREINARNGHPTLWTGVKPAWAKKGEHLCGICASKRLWPGLVREMVEQASRKSFSRRFVVSTHVLAMADDLERLVREDPQKIIKAASTHADFANADTAALPRQLMKQLPKDDENRLTELVKRIPAYIDDLRNSEDHQKLESFLQDIGLSDGERYYAVLLMDGDSMGKWLSGDRKFAIPFKAAWHPEVRKKAETLASTDEKVAAYLEAKRPASPARHVSISAALNGFSLDMARVVVEELSNGKLIYAGGDDVLALLSLDDALPAAIALRFLYGGHLPEGIEDLLPEGFSERFQANNGFVRYRYRYRNRDERLYMTMGPRATASAGLVIAHHMTPLSRVLAEVRQAEKQAKNSGRNALAITVMKRAGNVARIAGQWPGFTVSDDWQKVQESEPFEQTFPGLMARLAAMFRSGQLSRRAPYHVFQHLQRLPERKLSGLAPEEWNAMLKSMLVYQFKRQAESGNEEAKRLAGSLAADIADWGCREQHERPLHTLREFLGAAEFFGRRGREEDAGADKREDAA